MSSRRIRVMYVYKDFDVYNGLINSLLLVAKYMDHSRFDLSICLFRHGHSAYSREFERLGGRIIDLRLRWKDNPWVVWKLVRVFRREMPHVVQTFVLKPNLYGRIAAMLARVPVVIGTIRTLKDTAFSPLRRTRDALLHPFSRILDRLSHAVVVSSRAIRNEWDPGDRTGKYRIIYTPFARDRFVPHGKSELPVSISAGDSTACVRIGVISRLSEEKGIQYLIQALPIIRANVPGATLFVAGTGSHETRLRELSVRLGVEPHVVFLGHVYDVYGFLDTLQLFVMPSRSESLGVAIMEAMSASLPVVASKVGGIPEIVDNGRTGLLVPPGDPQRLAQAVVRLLRHPREAKSMGKLGRQRVSTRFSVGEHVRLHEHLYEELVLRKPGYRQTTG